MNVVVEEKQTLWDEVCRLSFFGGQEGGEVGGVLPRLTGALL